MGTWSTGPLDNDTALDFLHNLASKPTPAERELLLLRQLHLLCDYSPSHAERHTTDVELANQIGIAACAVVHMKLAAQANLYPYVYGYAPDADEPEDFRVEMLPEVSLDVLTAATGAISIARGLVGHPDLPEWTTDAAASEHTVMLEELQDGLYVVASCTPGHPAHVPDTPPYETDGLRTDPADDSVKVQPSERKKTQTMPVTRITTRAELIALARDLGVCGDWHEPDEQGVAASVYGSSLDTSGSWPVEEMASRRHSGDATTWLVLGLPPTTALPTPPGTELHVTLFKNGQPVAHVNLAMLFAWATGREAGDTDG